MGAYSAQVIADGASHYWRLEETAGLTAADAVAGGANAPGTIVGGVTLAQPGALSDGSLAMAFNGTTGKITIPTLAALSGAAAVSIELWARRAVASGNQVALQFGDASNYLLSDAANWTISANVAGVTKTVAFTLSDLQWHHVVATLDGANLRLYLDSVARGTTPAVGTLTTVNGIVAIGAYSTGQFWNGPIDEVAIYPLALTPAQIATHYALRTDTGGGVGPVPWGALVRGFFDE